MTFGAIFANLATAFSERFGGPFAEAQAVWPGIPVIDAGGSIITPATPIEAECRVQVDAATDTMRSAADFLATDVRLLVLGLTALDATAKITIGAATYRLMSVSSDPAGIGFECRGRKL